MLLSNSLSGTGEQAGQHVGELEEVRPAAAAPVDLPGKASTPPPRSSSLNQAVKQRTIKVTSLASQSLFERLTESCLDLV